MSNVHGTTGTWRCVCELNTVHIHVVEVSNHVLEPATYSMHLLSRAVQAGLGVSDLQPPEFGGLEVVGEQYAWYVEVCERAGYGAYPREESSQPCSGACHMQPAPTVPCCASLLWRI